MGRMARVKANGIEIEYEVLGDPAGAPLLMISGLGAQLTGWDDEFCKELTERGFHLIRYDNRDAGLSTKMESAGPADVMAVYNGEANPAYTLDVLADDAVGVLDALGIPAAHLVGASMGGFIAQLVAINHPRRVLSLTSIMSGPGGEDTVSPTPDAADVLTRAPGATREEAIASAVAGRRVLIGTANPFDPDDERRRASRAYDRSFYPVGLARQFAAILGARSRLTALAGVRVPTLVVHGIDDPLVPLENGRLVAKAVLGARLIELEGMGHNIPRRYWPVIADAIAETSRQASAIAS
jgi:pimeloyl-ACP methyl ester carboxylesterase